MDDGVSNLVGFLRAGKRTHRAALFGVPQGVLEGELGSGNALDCSAKPRGVDEGEHVIETSVWSANEPACCAIKLNLASGRSVTAHFVLDARRSKRV
eukprot:scaffold33986_cov35-Tisochrysis_lutea.AAC.2